VGRIVRITLKKPFSDGTVAVDMDPLSLLSRLAASVPAPRLPPSGITKRVTPFGTRGCSRRRVSSRSLSRTARWPSTWIRCRCSAVPRRRCPHRAYPPFGDHEARHTVRYAGVLASASKLRPRLAKPAVVASENPLDMPKSPRRGAYRPWAELLKRTIGLDVLTCPRCSGRMKLLALVTDPTRVADARRDPRRGSTCGALANRPTCRSGRPLEDRRTGQVVCSVEALVASRQPSKACATVLYGGEPVRLPCTEWEGAREGRVAPACRLVGSSYLRAKPETASSGPSGSRQGAEPHAAKPIRHL
jgi:hypothetical protein